MTVVVDTSLIIDHLRGDARARDALHRALKRRDAPPAASVLTRVEVMAGMRAGEEEATSRLLSLFTWVPVTDEIAHSAGTMARRYLRSHAGIDLTDYVIAATVEILHGELWTRNLKHFPMLTHVKDPCIS